jgi:hypothetical protein
MLTVQPTSLHQRIGLVFRFEETRWSAIERYHTEPRAARDREPAICPAQPVFATECY